MTDNNYGDDMPEKDGALTAPRPALPFGWLDHPDFASFGQHERHYAFQIVQNLDALSADQGKLLLNFLDKSKGFRL